MDEEKNPVSNYLDFARSVLKIPEAHEMICKYTVLDNDMIDVDETDNVTDLINCQMIIVR